jgi:two-component system OmpR family response regulator
MIPSLNRILIIEDDEIYRFELSDFLEQAGYEVFQATTGKNANEDIDLHKINLLILDLSLPGLNGFEIAREVKAVYSTIGIIVLTGRTARVDRIEGYNSGADIYLAKSTADHEEILAALGSLERRFEIASTTAAWNIHSETGRLTNNQTEISLQLTVTETFLIKLLLTAPDHILENDRIFAEIEQHRLRQMLDKRSVENVIARLKIKIAERFGIDQKSNPIIRSIRGIGYQLNYSISLVR